MCRGLAIGYNTVDGSVLSKGLSSHTATGLNDQYLNFEVIVDDNEACGYVLEVDDQYYVGGKLDPEVKKRFKRFFTVSGNVRKQPYDAVLAWIKVNEVQVLRWLLGCQSYARRKKDIDNSHQKTKGNTYNGYQKTGGNTYNSHQKTKGDTYNSCQETKGHTDNGYQKTKRDTYNSHQETGGNTYNNHQKTKGHTYNCCQETKGDIFVEYTINFDKKTDDFIKKLSDENNKTLTWKKLVYYAIKGYENSRRDANKKRGN